MNRIGRIALTIFIISMLCVSYFPSTTPVFAVGTTYYVSITGNDGNAGTIGSPWLTIQHAADTMVAGDTAYIRTGTYTERVYVHAHSGSVGNPITFSAYTGESPIVDGTGLSVYWGGLFELDNVDYINVTGLTIQNCEDAYGFLVTGTSNYINLTNLNIHTIYLGGIYIETTTNIVIDGCEVYDTNHVYQSNEQVSIMASDTVEIKNCVFYDSGKNGLDCKQGTINVSIHDNEIYGTGFTKFDSGTGTTTTGIYLDAGYGTRDMINYSIYNNKIHGCRSGGIVINSETAPYYSITNLNIYNNLIYDNYQGFVVWANPFTRNFEIINNTFYDNGNQIVVYGTYPNAGINSNCIIRNNIFYHTHLNYWIIFFADTIGGTATIDHNLYFDTNNQYFFQNVTKGSYYVQSSPMLTNPTSDFTLQVTSPAIDAGTSSAAPATDYVRTSRPLGEDYDMGAYEYNSLEAPTNVSATDGTATDKVVVTWTKSDFATGYKIYRSGTLIDTLGDVATYDDTGANPPTITVGTSSASDGTNTSYCTLGVSGEVSNNGTSYSYTVKATNDDGDSASSSANTGYRGSGLLLYQWQRSDNSTSYADLGSGTTDPYNDTTGTAGTTYYYRCKLSATDATDGYSSADTGSKAITETSATVTTGSVTSVLTTSATVAGNITGTGTSNVTQRGVCYSTSINPTTSDPKVNETSSSFSTGSFSKNLIGLVASTLYHVRAYAINSNGTSYGGDVSFTTSALTPTPTPTPTTTPNPLPTLAPYTNTSGFTDAVVGINGLIILVFMFVAVFGIILLISKGENIIIALVAAVVIIYLMVSFLPGLNDLIGGMFGLG
jgi:hypothetical protein